MSWGSARCLFDTKTSWQILERGSVGWVFQNNNSEVRIACSVNMCFFLCLVVSLKKVIWQPEHFLKLPDMAIFSLLALQQEPHHSNDLVGYESVWHYMGTDWKCCSLKFCICIISSCYVKGNLYWENINVIVDLLLWILVSWLTIAYIYFCVTDLEQVCRLESHLGSQHF